MLLQGAQVLGDAIAFVRSEIVLGVYLVQFAHDAVACNFCDDGCSCNERRFRIAIDHGLEFVGKLGAKIITIDE